MEKRTLHIAVVPSAGLTHLLPILQFSKRLVQLHQHLHVTCIIPSLGSPPPNSKSIFETLPSTITPIFLPPINPNDLPQGIPVEAQIQSTVSHSLPSIHQTLKALTSKNPLLALVVDSFAYEALDLAQEFKILSYIYFPSAAFTLSLILHLPELDEEIQGEYIDLQHPIQLPGCVPLPCRDIHIQAQNRTSHLYEMFLNRAKRFCLVDGIFINSFFEMEKGTIRALIEEQGSGKKIPPVYAVGPIVQTPESKDDDECLKWLDKQEACSVLYVSFGSGGTLTQEQIVELALGLELSNHKFLWVVRAPSSSSANAAYLRGQSNDVDPLKFLPFGFLERTKGKGFVIPSWAPQIQVLSHSSVGGFLSHCGWNSVLESVMHGVPLITWPLFAEQKMNAVLVCDGLRVGIRPRVNENGMVEKEEVAEVIKGVMEKEEGREMLRRMKELKEGATNAIKEDGDSTKILSQLILKWENVVKDG